jgi:hypothetical protein
MIDRPVPQLYRFKFINNASSAHHRKPITHMGYNGEIVAHEDIGELSLLS